MDTSGPELLSALKSHVLEAMRTMPECAAESDGAGNKAIEKAAGLALDLDVQDGWLTWSVLQALEHDGQVEVRRDKRRRLYRLAS